MSFCIYIYIYVYIYIYSKVMVILAVVVVGGICYTTTVGSCFSNCSDNVINNINGRGSSGNVAFIINIFQLLSYHLLILGLVICITLLFILIVLLSHHYYFEYLY